jgi:catechol 2,3-dioxygenase-like lactoylglutathione lyase family enzyme
MNQAVKINHVTILVGDKERAEKFYTEVLGLEKLNIGKSLWIKVGEQFIHISDNSGAPVPNSFYHFAIEFENFQEAIKNIISKGVDVFNLDDEIHPFNINTDLEKDNRQFFVRDYDGNLIELVDTKNKFFKGL